MDNSANAKKQILLIDDDTSLLMTLSDFLQFEGYEIVTADSGEQGLKSLEHADPDLIILDMSMPGMGGLGFLKAISQETGKPKYPVLVLTARANMAEFFANVEVDGFVAKPCSPADLLMEVSRIIFLRSRRAEQAEDTGSAQKPKVLIGEDDNAVGKRLLHAFGEAGYDAIVVGSGPEALEQAIAVRPDIIVLKLVLAQMNGDTVAQMLHEMPHTRITPVILYDDSSLQVPEAKYTEKIATVKRLVRDNTSASLLVAVQNVLGA